MYLWVCTSNSSLQDDSNIQIYKATWMAGAKYIMWKVNTNTKNKIWYIYKCGNMCNDICIGIDKLKTIQII